MAIATTEQFWNHRLNGEDPTSPSGDNNNAFSATGSGASEVDKFWVVTDARYNVTPTTDAYPLFAVFQYTVAPNNDEVLMSLDNGTKKVEVKAFGTKVKLVGATTVTSIDLDPLMAEENPVPLALRLTLDSSGNGRLYLREMVEDDDAQTVFLSVAGASGSSRNIAWGNNSGTIKWFTQRTWVLFPLLSWPPPTWLPTPCFAWVFPSWSRFATVAGRISRLTLMLALSNTVMTSHRR